MGQEAQQREKEGKAEYNHGKAKVMHPMQGIKFLAHTRPTTSENPLLLRPANQHQSHSSMHCCMVNIGCQWVSVAVLVAVSFVIP